MLSGRGCRITRAPALILSIIILSSSPSLSQGTAADLAASYKTRGRTIGDMVVDPGGSVHIAWTTVDKTVHDAGTLFYTRLDKSGRSSAETQITKFGGVEEIRLDVNSKNQAMVLYVQLKRLCIALFDESGAMRTEMDRLLTPEETDARFEFSRDDDDNLYLFGRGAIDYFWVIDPAGIVLQERRGRWIRQATPGFVCHILTPSIVLFVWNSPGGGAATIRSLKFDLSTFSHGASHEYDLGRIAEAKEDATLFSGARFVRSGKDLLYIATVRDSSAVGRTYRVRFNARGDPVRRWESKKFYHLQVSSAHDAGCAFRVGLPGRGQPRGKSAELFGIGRDGNMYHLKGSLPAFRSR